VALTTQLVVFDIVALSTVVHRWKVPIISGSAVRNLGVAIGTFDLLFRHVQGVGKNQLGFLYLPR
jgi:hypothetical protein